MKLEGGHKQSETPAKQDTSQKEFWEKGKRKFGVVLPCVRRVMGEGLSDS